MSEVFYRIIDNEDDDGRPPIITIRERNVYIISHTMYYRLPIPDGGFQIRDILDLRRRLDNRYTGPWIAAQLNRREYRGVAGTFVAELAARNDTAIYNARPNRAADRYQIFMRVIRDAQNDRPPAVGNALEIQTRRAHVPSMIAVDAVPANYTCVVCLLTSDETPGRKWVTADGCALHMFHRRCLRPWTGGNCMTCRRELQ
jgi:hypothetical protein